MYSFEKKSKEEYLEAVKQDGYALQYVKEKINELVKAVNKLNEEDTSKDIQCMTD